jgi:glycosyl transferase family 87
MKSSEAESAGNRQYLVLLGTLSLLVYGGIAWLSQEFVYGQGHAQRPILSFVGLYIGAWLFSMLAFRQVRQWSCRRLDVWLLIVFACSFRLVLLFSHPIQEDDFYRYLWDGKVLMNELNPYRVAPLRVLNFTKGLGPLAESPVPAADDEDLPRLATILVQDGKFGLILSRVNHPAVPTIYPPLAQAVFGLSALAAPGNLLALRLVFLGFDLAICGLIVAVLGHLGLNRLLVLVYAWSPLVIKETINSSHYDVVPTFFLVLALLLYVKERVLLAYLSVALAILGKIYPLLLLPIFVWKTVVTHGRSQALLGLGLVIGVIVLGYAPFVDAGPMLWRGTLAFVESWQTNSLLFPLLQWSVGNRWVANSVVALLLGCSLLRLLLRHDVRDDREFLWVNFFALGLLFLCSPAGNPWYFLWLVPFLCIFPQRSWLLLSGSLGLYYLWFYCLYHGAAETFRWILWLEYLPFYGMLLWEWYASRGVDESSPLAKPFLRSSL